jgi:hypothetical protein
VLRAAGRGVPRSDEPLPRSLQELAPAVPLRV